MTQIDISTTNNYKLNRISKDIKSCWVNWNQIKGTIEI